jgi:thymidylate synthase
MVLPPCHWAFELYTEELTLEERHKLLELADYSFDMTPNSWESEYDLFNIPKRRLSLKWHQRSCDFFLGVPFNIASYALLLEILSKEVNMVPGTLVGDLTNVHIYNNHIEQMEEQISRDPHKHKYPKLVISNNTTWGNGIDEMLGSVLISDFQVEGYESYPPIKGELSN